MYASTGLVWNLDSSSSWWQDNFLVLDGVISVYVIEKTGAVCLVRLALHPHFETEAEQGSKK